MGRHSQAHAHPGRHTHSPYHTAPSAYKEDYRDILNQRSPDQYLAVTKVILTLLLLTVIVGYLFVKA